MSEKTLNTRIVNKHDTEANWNKATNFTPKQGEVIIYDKDLTHPYERVKVGDGTTLVKNLPFIDNHDVKADNVHFTDGKTFQQKLDDGSLKGQDGAPGKNGSQGPQGSAATVNVHSTVTLAEGSNAKVINMGNANAANFKFEIPRGATGKQGPTGERGATGAKGADGKSVTHSWSGSKLTLTSASGTTTTDLRGPQGNTGGQGPIGPQGPAGQNGSQGPTGESGVATQTSQPSDSSVKVWVNPNGRTLNLMTESDLVGLATKDEVATVDERVTLLSDRVDNLKPDTSGLVKKTELLNLIYPIGSIYMNKKKINPNELLGGTWTIIAEGRYLVGADGKEFKIGQNVEAGLPNITGNVIGSEGGYGGIQGTSPKFDGAFQSSITRGNSAWDGSHAYMFDLKMDASKSNPIYGNSTTVRPAGEVVCVWERTA